MLMNTSNSSQSRIQFPLPFSISVKKEQKIGTRR